MSASQPDLAHIFKEIDTNADGFISRADLQATPYAGSLFNHSQITLKAFSHAHENKMNLSDFSLLYHAHSLKFQSSAVIEAVIAKFEAAKFVNKYLSVSAPGAAGPSVKQSYLRLVASNEQAGLEHQHSIGIEIGVDKPLQEVKIKQITHALGHPPHQVFFLLKFKCKSEEKGSSIAQKLQSLLHEAIAFGKELAAQLQQVFNLLKVYAKYSNGYIYLVVEVDNPFVDAIISFFNEVIQAISPECSLRFKAKLSSAIKDLLKETFNYANSSGQILMELDIDSVTLHKLKQIMGDNLINNGENPPINLLFALLFEQLRLSAQFSTLGEALKSTFNQDIDSFPKPYDSISTIKGFGIKQTLGQFFEGSADFISELQEHCEFEGELSLNLHDIYLKLNFDLDVEQAFDLL